MLNSSLFRESAKPYSCIEPHFVPYISLIILLLHFDQPRSFYLTLIISFYQLFSDEIHSSFSSFLAKMEKPLKIALSRSVPIFPRLRISRSNEIISKKKRQIVASSFLK